MEKGLSCQVVWFDDDLIELEVAAWNGAFGGQTRLYVGAGVLEDAASLLTGFPSNSEDKRLLILGAFGPEFAGGAMSLAFSQRERAGHAEVQVVVEGDGEVSGTTETVTLVLPFEVASLDEFVGALRRLEVERKGSAFLRAAG